MKGEAHPRNVMELSLAVARCERGWEADQSRIAERPECQGEAFAHYSMSNEVLLKDRE